MRQIAVCAHRGASEGRRPGTLESFRRAAESRFDYVEFDVRRLVDGALVAFHDPACNGRDLAGLTLDDLSQEAGYAVPRVEEVMTALRGLDPGPHRPQGARVRAPGAGSCRRGPGVRILRGHHPRGRHDRHDQARLPRRPGGTVARAWSGRRTIVDAGARADERALPAAAATRLRAPTSSRSITGWPVLNVLRVAKQMGMPVFVWTVNDSRSLVRFARSAVVECIVTDEPEKAAELLGLTSPSPPAP